MINKYENFYPMTPCFQDKETSLKKKDTMCSYCYSCYVEMCETISKTLNIPIRNNGVLRRDCLKYLDEEIFKKIGMIEYYKEDFNRLKDIIKKIIAILNKYTSYSNIEKVGYNLLHISFIECISEGLDNVFRRCYMNEIFQIGYKYTDKNLRKILLYDLNILCLEAYFNYINKIQGVEQSMSLLYELAKKENI